jgi:solute:Na+ symporter, SSS family
MHWIDMLVFAAYMAGILWVGYYFYSRNKGNEDYFLAGRDMSYPHIDFCTITIK